MGGQQVTTRVVRAAPSGTNPAGPVNAADSADPADLVAAALAVLLDRPAGSRRTPDTPDRSDGSDGPGRPDTPGRPAAFGAHTGDPAADELLDLLLPLLAELCASLTPRQRTVAGLLLVDGLRQAEIAERLQVRRSTVSALVARSRIRAIDRLARALRLVLAHRARASARPIADAAATLGPVSDANPWRRLASRIVYSNPWITVEEDDVVRPDGQPGIYGVVRFPGRAVGVVAFDDRDRVVLVGQYRYTLDRYSWEIPEGGSGDDEPLDAAGRELAEETGLRATEWRELTRVHLSNSVTDEEAILYVARGLTPGEATPEGTERLDVRWVTFDEALRMVEDGAITDAMTVIALQAVALRRLRGEAV